MDPPLPSKKSPGTLFGEICAEIFDEIPQGYHRDMMKMEVMKIMYETKYRAQSHSGADYASPLNVQTRPLYNSRVTPTTPQYNLPLSSPMASTMSSPHFNPVTPPPHSSFSSQDNSFGLLTQYSPQYNPLTLLGQGNGPEMAQ